MKVLMTGATGFLGKRILPRLIESGHSIHVLTRSPDRARGKLPAACELFRWDGTHEPVPPESLAGVGGILHLAGESLGEKRWSEEQKRRIYDSRVLGTRSLVTAINAMPVPPQVFVGASAVGYYGVSETTVFSESSPSGEGFLADVCRDWEAERKPLKVDRVCTIRIGVVLGTEGGALAKLVPLFRAGIGGPAGSGKQWMSWIHIEDVVSVFLWALTSPAASGVFNAVAEQPVTNGDFARTLGAVLGRPSRLRTPALALKLALGEMSTLVLDGAKVVSERLAREGFRFRFGALKPALEDLLKHQ